MHLGQFQYLLNKLAFAIYLIILCFLFSCAPSVSNLRREANKSDLSAWIAGWEKRYPLKSKEAYQFRNQSVQVLGNLIEVKTLAEKSFEPALINQVKKTNSIYSRACALDPLLNNELSTKLPKLKETRELSTHFDAFINSIVSLKKRDYIESIKEIKKCPESHPQVVFQLNLIRSDMSSFFYGKFSKLQNIGEYEALADEIHKLDSITINCNLITIGLPSPPAIEKTYLNFLSYTDNLRTNTINFLKNRAEINSKENYHKEAKESITKAIFISPEKEKSNLEKIRESIISKGVAYYEKCVRESQEIKNKDYQKAKECLNDKKYMNPSLDISVDFNKIDSLERRQDVESLLKDAEQERGNKHYSNSIDLLNQALKKLPYDQRIKNILRDVRDEYGKWCTQEGKKYLQKNDLETALLYYDTARVYLRFSSSSDVSNVKDEQGKSIWSAAERLYDDSLCKDAVKYLDKALPLLGFETKSQALIDRKKYLECAKQSLVVVFQEDKSIINDILKSELLSTIEQQIQANVGEFIEYSNSTMLPIIKSGADPSSIIKKDFILVVSFSEYFESKPKRENIEYFSPPKCTLSNKRNEIRMIDCGPIVRQPGGYTYSQVCPKEVTVYYYDTVRVEKYTRRNIANLTYNMYILDKQGNKVHINETQKVTNSEPHEYWRVISSNVASKNVCDCGTAYYTKTKAGVPKLGVFESFYELPILNQSYFDSTPIPSGIELIKNKIIDGISKQAKEESLWLSLLR